MNFGSKRRLDQWACPFPASEDAPLFPSRMEEGSRVCKEPLEVLRFSGLSTIIGKLGGTWVSCSCRSFPGCPTWHLVYFTALPQSCSEVPGHLWACLAGRGRGRGLQSLVRLGLGMDWCNSLLNFWSEMPQSGRTEARLQRAFPRESRPPQSSFPRSLLGVHFPREDLKRLLRAQKG